MWTNRGRWTKVDFVANTSRINLARTPGGWIEIQPYSFFNLGGRWMWVVNATPRALYQRGRGQVNIVQEAGSAPGAVRKIPPPPGCEPRTVQPLMIGILGYLGIQSSTDTVNIFMYANTYLDDFFFFSNKSHNFVYKTCSRVLYNFRKDKSVCSPIRPNYQSF